MPSTNDPPRLSTAVTSSSFPSSAAVHNRGKIIPSSLSASQYSSNWNILSSLASPLSVTCSACFGVMHAAPMSQVHDVICINETIALYRLVVVYSTVWDNVKYCELVELRMSPMKTVWELRVPRFEQPTDVQPIDSTDSVTLTLTLTLYTVTDWLTDWLTDRPTDRQTDRPTDWLTAETPDINRTAR
jgi:hypothetical protein